MAFVDLDRMAAMYEAAGLTCDILPGARTRAARLFAGGYGAGGPRGSDIHHTAQSTSTSDQASINYLAGISHPSSWVMASVYPWKSVEGKVTLIAAGPTYTAGRGGPIGDIPLDKGNNYGWSIEAPNNGVGEVWPTHLIDTMVTLSAVHAEFFGWEIKRDRIFSHWEYAPTRKIDPWGPPPPDAGFGPERWNMDLFRWETKQRWEQLYATPPPPEEEEEDMQIRYTTTNRDGQFLIGSGMPVFLSNDMVDEQFNKVPKVVGSGPSEDDRWDQYKAIWDAAQVIP